MALFYDSVQGNYGAQKIIHWGNIILTAIGVFVLISFLSVGFGFLGKWYDRYQARQDAENQVAINTIVIQQQEQNIQVEKQKAQIRVVDAQGIAQAQQIIAASLTDSYLQYLAIDAQKAMAQGANHTEIYIPSGANGIPLVKTIGQ